MLLLCWLPAANEEFDVANSEINGGLSNLISIDEAISISNERMNSDLLMSTRSLKKVANVEYIRHGELTRGDQASGFYIINYDNDGGFALISADARDVEKVYAISDKGSLNASDTIDNQGLNWYINSVAPAIQLVGINPPVIDRDTIIVDKEGNKHYCRPLLNDVVAGMAQGVPYNSLCPYNGVEHAFIGCVPLSAAQVMAYYKWPKSAQGNTYNWDEMLEDANHKSWPILFEILGRKENIDVQYGYPHDPDNNSSLAYMDSLQHTFKNYGYSDISSSSFKVDDAKQILKNKMPIIIDGKKTEWDGFWYRWPHHAYVVDGGYTHQYFADDRDLTVKYSEYFHCIWGGSGGAKGNGYFLYDNGVLKDDAVWQLNRMYYGFNPIR